MIDIICPWCEQVLVSNFKSSFFKEDSLRTKRCYCFNKKTRDIENISFEVSYGAYIGHYYLFLNKSPIYLWVRHNELNTNWVWTIRNFDNDVYLSGNDFLKFEDGKHLLLKFDKLKAFI